MLRNFHRLLFLLVSLNLKAQTPQFEWAAQMSSSGLVEAYAVDVDMDGNVITMGYFTSETDFDPGPGETLLTPQGGADIFLQKLDSLGDLVWVRQIGGAGLDGITMAPPPIFTILKLGGDIKTDSLGNVYVVGGIGSDSIDLDPGADETFDHVLERNIDGIVLKLDPDGELIWGHTFGSTGVDARDYAYGCVLGDQALYLCGTFMNTVDMDPSPANEAFLSSQQSGSPDYFVQKIDVDGNLVWVVHAPALVDDIDISLNEHVYVTGTFQGTVDFDPGSDSSYYSAQSGSSSYLLKLDAAGIFNRVDVFHSFANGASCLAIDAEDNVWVTKSFSGLVDVNPTQGGVHILDSDNTGDHFFIKLNSNGDLQFAGQSHLKVYDMVCGVDNDLYAIGPCSGSGDADPGPNFLNLMTEPYDACSYRITSVGDLEWIQVFESLRSNSSTTALVLKTDLNRNVYSAGGFVNAPDFDPSVNVFTMTSTNSPWPDGFVAKWSQLDTTVGVTEVLKGEGGVLVYPNPTSDVVHVLFKDQMRATVLVTDVLGRTVYGRAVNANHGNNVEVDVSNWNKGVYMFMIDQNENRQVIRVVKN